MARRQTYREGPSTTDEYDAIFDPDPEEQVPYYNKRYESHLYQTEQEKAQEIFRLLRALSEHLDAQDRKWARRRHPRPRDANDGTGQHNTETMPSPPAGTDRPEDMHSNITEQLSSKQRPAMNGNGRPTVDIPAPDTIASEASYSPPSPIAPTRRDTHLHAIPMREKKDGEHNTLVGGLGINRDEVSSYGNPTKDDQTDIPGHITQVIDVNPGDLIAAAQAAESTRPPKQPRTGNPTPGRNRERYEHTLRGFNISANRRKSTPVDSSNSSSEGGHEAHTQWQPINTSTPNPGSEHDTNHTTCKPSSTPNWKEPFTGRDTRLIPDRGKSFKRS